MALNGLLAVVLPKQALRLNARLLLGGYENPGDLEPKEWYVQSTRVAGVGMLVTGLVGLLVGGVEADEDGDDEVAPIDLEVGEDGDSAADADADGSDGDDTDTDATEA